MSGKVSTDFNEIWNFLKSYPETIVYSTYQSLDVIQEAITGKNFEFDLAICDEAHRTAGSKLGKFGLIHSDTNIPVKKRLYMTATPRVLSDKLKNNLNKEKIDYTHDMSNFDIFGPELYKMSFKEAIEQEIILDYKIFAIGVNDQEIYNAIRRRKYSSDTEKVDEIANNFALQKFMNIHNSNHAITFHSTIRKAKKFQIRHKNVDLETDVYHVSGEISTNKRSLIIKEFEKSPKAVMTNARCLTEGINMPVIDVIYFCDPGNQLLILFKLLEECYVRQIIKIKRLDMC